MLPNGSDIQGMKEDGVTGVDMVEDGYEKSGAM